MNLIYKPTLSLAFKLSRRHYSIKDLSSQNIRQSFYDYFIHENHKWVPSSSVIPFQDTSLAFVNAGMNQFKQVFLGTEIPQYPCIVNSQKCIRVGGKHNDLKDVGLDGYHHTFFEMLGNWSFGKYFKFEACKLALDLLTNKFGLPVDCLYFTYFQGDNRMNLPPDVDSRNCWLELGIPENQILPFGLKHNFWEMAQTGPCGPCTEIHYAKPGTINPELLVNQDCEDVLELWNLVFMEYERALDGSLSELPIKHVDTGMGLERLVAILQGCKNNYDTDLFRPLFEKIYHLTGCSLYGGKFKNDDISGVDTAYRRLADHARMITVALSDGMFPDENHSKLRYVLRRAFQITENDLGCYENVLPPLSEVVCSILGDAYPEISRMLPRTTAILTHEYKLYHRLCQEGLRLFKLMSKEEAEYFEAYPMSEIPGLLQRYRECISNVEKIPKDEKSQSITLLELYSKFKLPIDLYKSILKKYGIHKFEFPLIAKRETFQPTNHEYSGVQRFLKNSKIPGTNDTFKYDMSIKEGNINITTVTGKIIALFRHEHNVEMLSKGDKGVVVTDISNFFSQEGGQVGDKGHIYSDESSFMVENAIKMDSYVLHLGSVVENTLRLNQLVELNVDGVHRKLCSVNHTATHLLNSAISATLGFINQTSSFVNDKYLKFEFQSYQGMLSTHQVQSVQQLVNSAICAGLEVKTTEENFNAVLKQSDIILMPFEKYPTTVRVVSVQGTDPQSGYIDRETLNFSSKELCCGTHVSNTEDITKFVITNVTAPQEKTIRSIRSIKAVTGELAEEVLVQSRRLNDTVKQLNGRLKVLNKKNNKSNLDRYEIDSVLNSLQEAKNYSKCKLLEFTMRVNIESNLNECERLSDAICRKLAIQQFKDAQFNANGDYYIDTLYGNHSGAGVTKVGKKLASLCQIPSMVFLYTKEGFVRGRCLFPKALETPTFNAALWTSYTAQSIMGESILKNDEEHVSVYLVGTSYHSAPKDLVMLMDTALKAAKDYADKHNN